MQFYERDGDWKGYSLTESMIGGACHERIPYQECPNCGDHNYRTIRQHVNRDISDRVESRSFLKRWFYSKERVWVYDKKCKSCEYEEEVPDKEVEELREEEPK